MKDYKRRNIKIRMNQKLFTKLELFCNEKNITKSVFIRNAIKYLTNKDNSKVIFSKDRKFKKELLYELRRYGNNLNQIAYKLNVALKSTDLSYSEKLDVKTAINDLNKICQDTVDLRHLICERL